MEPVEPVEGAAPDEAMGVYPDTALGWPNLHKNTSPVLLPEAIPLT